MNFIATKPNNVELLLDTSFLLGLFDLMSPESKHTCSSVARLAKVLGYKLTVLDITLEETSALLRRIANKLSTALFVAMVDMESIEAACERRKLSKTELELISRRVPENLIAEYEINCITVDETFKEEAKQSEIYSKCLLREHNPDGAPHDGIAFYYPKVSEFIAQNWY